MSEKRILVLCTIEEDDKGRRLLEGSIVMCDISNSQRIPSRVFEDANAVGLEEEEFEIIFKTLGYVLTRHSLEPKLDIIKPTEKTITKAKTITNIMEIAKSLQGCIGYVEKEKLIELASGCLTGIDAEITVRRAVDDLIYVGELFVTKPGFLKVVDLVAKESPERKQDVPKEVIL